MNIILLGLAAIFALFDGWAAAAAHRRVEQITKPAVVLVLIAAVCLAVFRLKKGFFAPGGLDYGLLPFLAGLIFSFAADILRIRDRHSPVRNLLAYAPVHIAYMIGFNPIPPAKPQHLIVAGLVLILVALPAAQVYRRIAAAIEPQASPQQKGIAGLYSFIVGLMLAAAMFTMMRGGWQPFAAIAVVAGAAAFSLSFVLHAWSHWITPFGRPALAETITYHLGQILIITGAILQYLTAPV